MMAAQLFQATIGLTAILLSASLAVFALATERLALGFSQGCARVCPTTLEGKMLGGLYRRFRLVALIQFGLEPLGAKVAESPQKPSEEYSVPL